MTTNALAPHVLDRLLLCKFLLRYEQPEVAPTSDARFIATRILSAHDASEMALAAIADHLGVQLPAGDVHFSVYLDKIQSHLNKSLPNREFFRQLNLARNLLKHSGVHPRPEQFLRVTENTYNYISEWLEEFVGITLAEVDEALLIQNEIVRSCFEKARERTESGDPKSALENLAIAMSILFENSAGLWTIGPSDRSVENAIRLAGLGVRLNEYLALQHLVPEVLGSGENATVKWNQNEFGHPGNWNTNNAEFCLRSFVELAVHCAKCWFRAVGIQTGGSLRSACHRQSRRS